MKQKRFKVSFELTDTVAKGKKFLTIKGLKHLLFGYIIHPNFGCTLKDLKIEIIKKPKGMVFGIKKKSK